MTKKDAILCLKGMKNYARDTFTEQASVLVNPDGSPMLYTKKEEEE